MSAALDVAVRHRLGDFVLDAAFTAGPGLTALFGPSGSGKSSIIRMIAGLLRPAAGHVVLDGETLSDAKRGIFMPKHRRGIAVVFQEPRLFPHMTVARNLIFGARPTSQPAEVISIAQRLGITHLLERRPAGLSGGEAARVAIGRALLARPRLLLMDEPLASLDAPRRDEILPMIERLRDEAGIPIVYVSHAVAEVARLATTLVVMEAGRVVAAGQPGELFGRVDIAVLGQGAVLDARLVAHETGDLSRLATAAGDILLPKLSGPPGRTVRVRIDARDVTLSLDPPGRSSALNVLTGPITEIVSAGAGIALARVACGTAHIVARITAHSAAQLALAPGTVVHAMIKSVSIDTGGG